MKTPNTERVKLADCLPGNRVNFFYQGNRAYSIGHVRIVKIKQIMGNKLQVKYSQEYLKVGKVHKINVPADFIVDRYVIGQESRIPENTHVIRENEIEDDENKYFPQESDFKTYTEAFMKMMSNHPAFRVMNHDI